MAASGCAARGGPAHRRAAPCAERVARGGASCELACCLLAQPQHTDTLWSLGGFCLLAHNSNIVSAGLMTMSPAHGVGPLFW